ncbi:TetR/AcrR family transcriptional regulator C-terminal domain-containing protein [Streptosporangiaceae bacterium NEAU-GS5]|nr:TetR/AcrR family transcriptional regulator C-terminal domain-containing protein [Streptosporangiaceae bacterium NEAU-GS5]
MESVWARARHDEPGETTKAQREPGLSREAIIQGAMELLDAEGIDALSMRKLATRLASGATSIYWYVESKDQLLELVMDAVYGEVAVPVDGSWRKAAEAFAAGLRKAVFHHPWLVSLVGALPAIGPNAMTASERLVGAFKKAGFEGWSLDYAVAAITSYALGAAIPSAAWQNAHRKQGRSIQETVAQMAPTIHFVSADYPNLSEMVDRYYGGETDVEQIQQRSFYFGLNALLDGLEACLP